MKVLEILTESRKDFAQTTSELPSDALVKKLSALLKKYLKAAEKLKTKSDSIPGAPDSSKFKAHRSGEVSLESNVVIHGSYNTSVTYQHFLKIGGAIPFSTRNASIDEKFMIDVEKLVAKVATEDTHIECSDGKTVSIAITHGTNWGGIGIKY